MKAFRTILLLGTLLAGLSGCSDNASQSSAPSPSPALTATEKAALAQLEGRPLKLPPLASDGSCPSTEQTSVKPFKDQNVTTELYGSGPVYAGGGPESRSAKNAYYYVTYVADPTVRGVVLIRIATLDGLHRGVFFGNYASGTSFGTDTIDGRRHDIYGELALPVARPSPKADLAYAWKPDLAAGWVAWQVFQGVDASWTCVGIQIDSDSATEVVVVAG